MAPIAVIIEGEHVTFTLDAGPAQKFHMEFMAVDTVF
jgi:hypothetical protein